METAVYIDKNLFATRGLINARSMPLYEGVKNPLTSSLLKLLHQTVHNISTKFTGNLFLDKKIFSPIERNILDHEKILEERWVFKKRTCTTSFKSFLG